MRQVLAVSGLLLLIGLPTLFIAEGGWEGVERHWVAPASQFVTAQIRSFQYQSAEAGTATRTAAAGEPVDASSHVPVDELHLVQRPSFDPFTAAAAEFSLEGPWADKPGPSIDATNVRSVTRADRLRALTSDPDNAEIRYEIAMDYLGAPTDYIAAAQWLTSAAELGYPRAQFALGQMYIEGTGVDRDYPKAFMWLTLATDGLSTGDELVVAVDRLARLNRAMTPGEYATATTMLKEWQPKTFVTQGRTEVVTGPTMLASSH